MHKTTSERFPGQNTAVQKSWKINTCICNMSNSISKYLLSSLLMGPLLIQMNHLLENIGYFVHSLLVLHTVISTCQYLFSGFVHTMSTLEWSKCIIYFWQILLNGQSQCKARFEPLWKIWICSVQQVITITGHLCCISSPFTTLYLCIFASSCFAWWCLLCRN